MALRYKILNYIFLVSTSLLITSSNASSVSNEWDFLDHGQDFSYKPPHELAYRAYNKAVAIKRLDNKILKKLSILHPEEFLRRAGNSKSISNKCWDAFLFVLEGQTNQPADDPWATKFLDSWGIPGSGIFEGHSKFPGSYDECKAITVARPVNSTLISGDFSTKYCTSYVPLIPKLVTLQMGVCAPDVCTSGDMSALYNATIGHVLPGGGVVCQEADYTMPAGSVGALVFVSILIGICVLATAYDGVLQLISSWYQERRSAYKSTRAERTPLLSSPGQLETEQPEQGLFTKTILAFSLYSNAGKVLNTDQPPNALTCLNGIRFFSMTWVILGHCVIMYSFSQLNNTTFVEDLFKNFASQAVMNATVSVDTFFVLSGMLVSYLFLRDFHRRNIQTIDFFKALPFIYLHRYFRLTPAYGIMILIITTLAWYVWEGPFWPNPILTHFQSFDGNCESNWYLSLLYVNNLFQADKMCAGWGWYLANDMQFFLVAPFIVYIFYVSSFFGVGVCIVTILGSISAAIGVSDQQHTSMTVSNLAHNNFTMLPPSNLQYYDDPWTRYQTYGVGLLTGCLIWKFKQMDLRIPKFVNLLLWGVSAALCMSVVYGPYDANMGYHTVHLFEAVLYNGFSRTAWAIGISYVMISCSLGQGGWVNDFLSWRGFVPLSRLTYCAYLIHIPIMYILGGGARTGTYYTYIKLAIDVVLITTLAYLVAFVFSLLFEVPFINIDKLYLAPRSIKKDRHAMSSKTDIEETPPPEYQPREEGSSHVNLTT